MIRKEITIINKLGLHARASAKLVALAGKYVSQIELVKDTHIVNCKSIMGLLTLGAAKGTELVLLVDGEDETDACEAVINMINDKFGEAE